MMTLRRTARHLTLAAAFGYLLTFYSERAFYAIWQPADTLRAAAFTWAAYSAAGYLLLALLHATRVAHWTGLLVAGSLFGWLIEGTWASTLYGTEPSAPFPLSIVVTAIQWHALFSVLVGLWLLPHTLRRAALWPTLALAAAIGLVWGAWAPFQWGETPPRIVPLPAFAAHATLTFGLCIVAYGLLDRLRLPDLHPSRSAVALLVALHAVVYLLLDLLPLGLRALLLLPLLALGLALLGRGRAETGAPLLDALRAPVPAPRYLALLTAPLAASAVYALALALGERWPPLHMAIWIGATLAGALLWLYAAVRLLRRTPPATPTGA